MKNWLIGIGGTGARVVEAVVHLCAAGLGPNELNVFLVDPDEANGNLARTTSLLADYNRCQLTERTKDVPFFRTKIRTPPEVVWKIFTDKSRKLKDFIRLDSMRTRNPALGDLASVLFTDQELDTDLSVGFRGHPSIGAVVMSDLDTARARDPWKAFFDDISTAERHQAKVFLAGSIFGGTGAAGVPTFGSPKVIKHHPLATTGDGSKVWLGAALILPYFEFKVDEQTAAKEGMFARPVDFPLATKAALDFYYSKDLAFDEIYLLGDSQKQETGSFSVGRASQCNRPHYIELAAALAAFDFLAQPVSPDPTKTCLLAKRKTATVDWHALPVTRTAETNETAQRKLKFHIASMATFAYALATHGREVLDGAHEAQRDTWYRDHIKFNAKRDDERARDPRGQEPRSRINAFDHFGLAFLKWIADISADAGVELVDGLQLLDDQGRLVSPRQAPANVGHFVLGGQPKGLRFDDFIGQALNSRKIGAPMTPSNLVLNLFAEASTTFCRLNLGVNQ